MIAFKIRRPLLIAAQFSILSLGVSAVSLHARAADEGSDDWVWGVAARDAVLADATAPGYIAYGALGTNALSGPGIFAVGTTGAGVTIAIVDTGIDYTHPEFAGRIAAGGTCLGSGCNTNGSGGFDDNGHGTHVAGIAAAANDGHGNTGVAPGAMLLPVKVLAASGGGSYGSVAQGITYAAAQGAQVINMSLGGPVPNLASDYNGVINAMKLAAPTSVMVIAAGNSGNGRIVEYPAAFGTQVGIAGSVIIAGSLRPNGTSLSRFSNTPGNEGCVGRGTARTCFKDIFLLAPGENIYSTLPGNTYGDFSGTSMATPYIAGAAALVFSAAPYLTPKEVTSILFMSAIDLGKPGPDPIYGRGVVNPSGAIAPLGFLSVATSGATTAGRSGTGNIRVSGLTGAFASGLRGSQAAHDLTLFDAFNRDYKVDLTKSVATGLVSLAGAVAQAGQALRLVTFFGESYSASGFVSEPDVNSVAFNGVANLRTTELHDAVIAARLSDGVSMTLGYNAGAAGRLNQLDLAASEAFDGLFMSATAMNSPYLGFAGGANLIGADVAVGDGVSLSLGHVSQEAHGDGAFSDEILTVEEKLARLRTDDTHLASGDGSAAAISWRLGAWGLAGVNVAYADEQNALFGGVEAGALALTGQAETLSAGFGVRANLGDDWVASASWNAGVSKVTPLAGGLFANVSELRTAAYGIALAKQGLFAANDTIGVGVSQPLHIVDGSALLVASTGVTKAREIVYSRETISLASATPETDFEFGYTARLSARTWLQANAMYQFDVGGTKGSDAIAGLATVKTVW